MEFLPDTFNMSCRKLRKGKNASQIAEELEEDLPVIQDIVIAASDFAPEYDTDAIFKSMVSEKTVVNFHSFSKERGLP